MKFRLFLGAILLAVTLGSVLTYRHFRSDPVTVEAERLLSRGDIRGALLVLRKVTRDDQKDSHAFVLLGTAHERLGDFTSAERDFVRARALGANRAEIAIRLAPIYLDTRRFQRLIDETPMTASDPAVAAKLLAFRSRAFTGLNAAGAAASSLLKARTLMPASDEVLIADARNALIANDPKAAETAVDGALKSNPTNLEALLLKSQLRAGSNDSAGALSFATRAVGAAPLLVAPRLARAKILLDSGELDKARADLVYLETLGYRNPEAIYLLAVIATRQGQFVDAAGRFDSIAAELAAFPRASYYQALGALARNLPSTAVDFASRYVKQFPADPNGIRLLARADIADNRPDLAADILGQAIARNVSDPETAALYSGALARMGELAKAQAALAVVPAGPRSAAQLAELETRRGNYTDALARLERARSVSPNDTAILENLVQTQIAKGDVDAAAVTLEALKAKTGPTEAVGIFTGMLAMARFDVPLAIDAFSSTAKAFPKSVAATVNLARVLAATGQVDEARSRLRAMLANDPVDPLLISTLVQLEVKANRPEAAFNVLKVARQQAPADESLAIMASDLQIAAGDGPGAVATLTGLQGSKAPGPARWAALARAYKAAGQTKNEAESYQALIASNPGSEWSIPASLSLADLYFRTKRPDEARHALDDAIARAPGNLGLLSSRVQLEVVAQGPDAARSMAAKLRSDPAQMPAAAFLTGDLAMRRGNLKDAIAAFKAERPQTPALSVRIAEAQALSGDDQAAAAELATIPDDDAAISILAQIAVRAKRWPEAASKLERASQLRPNDPALLNNLAWAYLQINDKRAVTVARRAYLIDPNPDVADTLGWILAEQNAADSAVTILKLASLQSPQNPTIAYHLAVALARTGNTREARDTVQRALQTPTFDDRVAAQALAASLQAAAPAP